MPGYRQCPWREPGIRRLPPDGLVSATVNCLWHRVARREQKPNSAQTAMAWQGKPARKTANCHSM
jgi:hypothetical protein